VWALAADTDGIDGVEDNAGAIVTPDTLARAAPWVCGSTTTWTATTPTATSALGDLVVTGPTHTNVNDLPELKLAVIDVKPGAAMESQSGLQLLRPRIYGAWMEPTGSKKGGRHRHAPDQQFHGALPDRAAGRARHRLHGA
jgi:hypothetical protein